MGQIFSSSQHPYLNTSEADFLLAARHGHLEKVLEHLNSGVNVNTKNGEECSALHLASMEGHEDVVRLLIARKAPMEAVDKKGRRPLHTACLFGHYNIVKALLVNGAGVYSRTLLEGWTPLSLAAQENHPDIIRLLLSFGADPTIVDFHGDTPAAAARYWGSGSAVDVLIGKNDKGKESIRKPLTDQERQFLCAASDGDFDKVVEFLNGGMSVHTSNERGWNALHFAASEGHENIVKEMVARGTQVDGLTKKGRTALLLASWFGHYNIAKILMAHGANVNALSSDGEYTPLFVAAHENRINLVRLLLEHGADQGMQTPNTRTPLQIALHVGNEIVVDILQNYSLKKPTNLSKKVPEEDSEVSKLKKQIEELQLENQKFQNKQKESEEKLRAENEDLKKRVVMSHELVDEITSFHLRKMQIGEKTQKDLEENLEKQASEVKNLQENLRKYQAEAELHQKGLKEDEEEYEMVKC